MEKFAFVFHISLKDISKVTTIEKIIISQHKGLNANKVKPDEIKQILVGETNHKVLLFMDGYDQYKHGANIGIDNGIERESLWDCCVMVTSRNTKEIEYV